MPRTLQFMAVITRDGGEYVSLCPALDIASQGRTVEEARENLVEAVQLFYEAANDAEIALRAERDVHVMQIEIALPLMAPAR